MENRQRGYSQMVVHALHDKGHHVDNVLAEVSDDQLLREVAPGRNRGIDLVGHLDVLVNSMLPLVGYGENPAPYLVEPFVKTPDKQTDDLPTANELRKEWEKAKTTVEKNIKNTAPGEWFQKHTSISEEDFAKEPHRNKLNVVLSRASHVDYHLGQLIFLRTR